MESDNSRFSTPTGPYATPYLVGRTGLLGRVDELLRRPVPQQATVVFFTGDGGIGKTRFLLDILDRTRKDPALIPARQIIDFYHIQNHTTDGLIESICAVLPSEAFAAYQEERLIFERMRLSGNPSGLREQHQRVFDTFAADLRSLSATKPVLIALDTAERLLYATGRAAQTIGDAAESWQWLCQLLPTLQNVILLVAGRRESSDLQKYVEQQNVALIMEEIPPFSEEESLQYFEAVLKMDLGGEAGQAIARLAAFDEETRRTAAICAGGLPITLALLIDFLSVASAGEIPDDLKLSPAEATLRMQTEPGEVQRRLQEAFIRRILGAHRIGDTILALGRLPKGADAELLARVMDIAVEEATQRLVEVKHLSIVKMRPSDQRYFLHDVLYEMLNKYIYGGRGDTKAELVSQQVLRYYDELLTRIQQKISDWFQPVFETGKPSFELLTLAEFIVERQTILSEILYYRLRQDPISGFKRYYRYMREAILSGQPLLDLLLQTELLAFWYERDPDWQKEEIDGLPRYLVESLLAIRPITRACAEGKNDEAIRLAVEIRNKRPKDLFTLSRPETLAIFNAWEAAARIYVGGDENMTLSYDILTNAIEEVSPLVAANGDDESLRGWRQKAVLAFAYRVRGYLYWVRGDVQKSVSDYTEAVQLWRDVNLIIEYARSLNDLGFARSELGEVDDARALIEEAIRLQIGLGQYSMVALSINASALVELGQGKYDAAIKHSKQALSIFRSLGYIRGEGLALIALADSSRPFIGSVDVQSSGNRIRYLKDAAGYAERALTIFSDAIHEGSRQIQALNSLGCAQRDWAFLHLVQPDPSENPHEIKLQAEANLRKAAELAGAAYPHHRIIALVNLGWLGCYKQDDALIDEVLTEVDKIIPAEYKINPDAGQPSIGREVAEIHFWPQMGKLLMLSGIRNFERYQSLENSTGVVSAADPLFKAVQDFTLSLEYNALYSPNSFGIEKAKRVIYDHLKELPASVLRRVSNLVRQVANEHHIGNNSQIYRLMKQRVLWYD